MKLLRVVMLSLPMFVGSVNTVSAQVAPGYIGDKSSFAKFVIEYGKTDWPLPEVISYFDPSGNNEPVIRYARWVPKAAPATGVVVHFNGRTEFIERNIYTYKDLLDRGFEVWALDWRGQGLSKHQTNAKQRHSIDSFDTYLSDATHFIDRVVNIRGSNGKKILLAHSMGGQIALRYLLSDAGRGVFNYAVLSSPLIRMRDDSWYVRMGNRIKTSVGLGGQCVLGESDDWKSDFKVDACNLVRTRSATASALTDAGVARLYSNDLHKLADANCLVESSRDALGVEAPDLRLACPTSDWLHAVFESTDFVMKNTSRLGTPTLIIRAKPDAVVDNGGQSEFCAAAKIQCVDVEKIGDTQAGHELLIEIEPIRARFFTEFDRFVKTD